MFKTLKNILSCMLTLIKFSLIKIIRSGFSFYYIERFSPSTMINIWKNGKMHIGKKVSVHTGSRLSVTSSGFMKIGDGVKINYNCIIVCQDSITIDNGVEIGPNVVIYDHDHDFRAKGGLKDSKFKTAPVFIGENSWIGAGSIILRGTTIGKNCVIGAGSIVKGNIPDNTLVVQHREMEHHSIVRAQ